MSLCCLLSLRFVLLSVSLSVYSALILHHSALSWLLSLSSSSKLLIWTFIICISHVKVVKHKLLLCRCNYTSDTCTWYICHTICIYKDTLAPYNRYGSPLSGKHIAGLGLELGKWYSVLSCRSSRHIRIIQSKISWQKSQNVCLNRDIAICR